MLDMINKKKLSALANAVDLYDLPFGSILHSDWDFAKLAKFKVAKRNEKFNKINFLESGKNRN